MVCMRTDKANRLSILFACFCKENRIYSKMHSYKYIQCNLYSTFLVLLRLQSPTKKQKNIDR